MQRDQQPGEPLFAGSDLGVEQSDKEQRDGQKTGDQKIHGTEVHSFKYEEIVKADHPDGDRSFIKMLSAAEYGDEQIQQGGRNRQNDLTPHIGSFRTDEDKAGHYRANHAKYHHPGEEVLHTDIKMRFSFHNNVIITNYSYFATKN